MRFGPGRARDDPGSAFTPRGRAPRIRTARSRTSRAESALQRRSCAPRRRPFAAEQPSAPGSPSPAPTAPRRVAVVGQVGKSAVGAGVVAARARACTARSKRGTRSGLEDDGGSSTTIAESEVAPTGAGGLPIVRRREPAAPRRRARRRGARTEVARRKLDRGGVHSWIPFGLEDRESRRGSAWPHCRRGPRSRVLKAALKRSPFRSPARPARRALPAPSRGRPRALILFGWPLPRATSARPPWPAFVPGAPVLERDRPETAEPAAHRRRAARGRRRRRRRRSVARCDRRRRRARSRRRSAAPPGGCSPPAAPVQTATAIAPGSGGGAAAAVLQATGYITARRQATVSTQITGTLTEVLIEEGVRVEKGQVHRPARRQRPARQPRASPRPTSSRPRRRCRRPRRSSSQAAGRLAAPAVAGRERHGDAAVRRAVAHRRRHRHRAARRAPARGRRGARPGRAGAGELRLLDRARALRRRRHGEGGAGRRDRLAALGRRRLHPHRRRHHRRHGFARDRRRRQRGLHQPGQARHARRGGAERLPGLAASRRT